MTDIDAPMRMIVFEDPIQPETTRLSAEALQLIAKPVLTPQEYDELPVTAASDIADQVHAAHKPDLTADGLLPKDHAQAYFDHLAPQIPEGAGIVGRRVANFLHAYLLGTGAQDA